MCKIIESSRSCNDDVGNLVIVLEICLILFKRHSSEIASVSQLGFLEIPAQSFEILVDLMSKFSGMACDYCLMRVVALTFSKRDNLIQD